MHSPWGLIAFVAAADLSRARSFYEGILGLRVTADEPSALVLDANGTMLRVSLVEHLSAAPYAWFKDPDGNLLSLTQFP